MNSSPFPADCQAMERNIRRAFAVMQNPSQEYGPWNRDLDWYESSDGLAFSRKGTFVERGGVPALIRSPDGNLFAVFQWFPLNRREAFDQVALKISSDQGRTWTAPALIPARRGGGGADLTSFSIKSG